MKTSDHYDYMKLHTQRGHAIEDLETLRVNLFPRQDIQVTLSKGFEHQLHYQPEVLDKIAQLLIADAEQRLASANAGLKALGIEIVDQLLAA